MKHVLLLCSFFILLPAFSATKNWISEARNGDAQAQYRVGKSYFVGDTIAQDIEQALFWLEKAAAQKEARAQYILGLCYYKGEGKEKNDSMAYRFFKSAALQGYPQAQYSLALRYLKGEGIKKDTQRAFHWFRKASEGGIDQARFSLGVRFQKGEGIEQNKEMALRLFRELTLMAPHDPFYDYYIGCCYYFGTCGLKDINTGTRFIQKAAVHGCKEAQTLLVKIQKQQPKASQVHYF